LSIITKDSLAAEYSCLTGDKYLDMNRKFLSDFSNFLTVQLPNAAKSCLQHLNLNREDLKQKSNFEVYELLHKSIYKTELNVVKNTTLNSFLTLMCEKFNN